MDLEFAQEIVIRYGKTLEKRKYIVGCVDDLPHNKEKIREAVLTELLSISDTELINALEIGYLELETYLSKEEYKIVKKFEKLFNKKLQDDIEKDKKLFSKIVDLENSNEYLEILNRIQERIEERKKEIDGIRKIREIGNSK